MSADAACRNECKLRVYDFGGRANVVETYISYLRKKVDAEGAPLIHTIRGMGYMLKRRGPNSAEP